MHRQFPARVNSCTRVRVRTMSESSVLNDTVAEVVSVEPTTPSIQLSMQVIYASGCEYAGGENHREFSMRKLIVKAVRECSIAHIEHICICGPPPAFLERLALEKQTRNIQSAFDDLVERIKNRYCFSDVKKALKKIPHAYSKVFKKAHTIDDLFLRITLPISWFHYGVLKFLLDQLEQDDISEYKAELVEYDVKLKHYFEERVKPLTDVSTTLADNNHSSRGTYIMNVDRNWDLSVLEGENCNKTCRKIASILGKSGPCILGDYHEPWLVITVS